MPATGSDASAVAALAVAQYFDGGEGVPSHFASDRLIEATPQVVRS